MKSCLTRIVFAFVCLIILPLALPAVAIAADDDSDFKLTPQQQKALDELPPEQRENILTRLRERRKKDLQILSAQKKIISRRAARPSSILEREFDENADNLRTFDVREWNEQEFLDYVGIDKELAETISKKEEKLRVEMLRKTYHTAILLKIAQASTADDEVDKLMDLMFADGANISKELATLIANELNPPQIEKLKELRMVNSSRNGSKHDGAVFFDFGQYEALALTDEQQKKIAVIKTEYLAAFEPLYQKELDMREQNKEILYHKDILNEAELSEEMKTKQEKIWTEIGDTYQPITQLNAATRARILALFTKEQIAKLEKVFTNAPKYLRKRVGLENKDAWKPSDRSWKPRRWSDGGVS
jgi:hypothetical protein